LVALASACGPGPADYEEDFTAEVEQICVEFCETDLACREPQWFQSYGECEHNCLHTGYLYNDTDCGEARRAVMSCLASQPTCELYNDTLNVHADQYTCQAEKEHWTDVGPTCWQSDEDPYPKGQP
jgi:hypothetical protein